MKIDVRLQNAFRDDRPKVIDVLVEGRERHSLHVETDGHLCEVHTFIRETVKTLVDSELGRLPKLENRYDLCEPCAPPPPSPVGQVGRG